MTAANSSPLFTIRLLSLNLPFGSLLSLPRRESSTRWKRLRLLNPYIFLSHKKKKICLKNCIFFHVNLMLSNLILDVSSIVQQDVLWGRKSSLCFDNKHKKIVASPLSRRQAVFIFSEEAYYNMMEKMSEIIKCNTAAFLQASPPLPIKCLVTWHEFIKK